MFRSVKPAQRALGARCDGGGQIGACLRFHLTFQNRISRFCTHFIFDGEYCSGHHIARARALH